MPQINKAVWAALASNLSILICKALAAAIGGSSSLLAETLHSLADTGDSLLLILGTHRSHKPPDKTHPFGHGMELYFWTFVVAVSIFGVGGVASILEGIQRILKPPPLEDPKWSYIVLILAALFEGTSMVYAWYRFLREAGKRSVAEAFNNAKDPTTFMVVFEDTAAFLGVLIALTAVFLAHHLELPWIDGAGAVAVGLLMAIVAIFLIREIQALIIGERLLPEDLSDVRNLIQSDPDIASITPPRTMHFGPESVLVAVRATFHSHLSLDQLAAAINRIHEKVRARHTEIEYLYIEPTAPGTAPPDEPPLPQ